MKQTFEYGNYSYEYFIAFSDRKTLGLMVRPDLRIITKVPYGTTIDEVEGFLRRKWVWLQKQLSELGRYQKKHYEREYVPGESFQYLGRQYMLAVEQGGCDAVRLERGRLVVYTTKNIRDSAHNRELLEGWYGERRNIVFRREYAKALKHFNYQEPPQLRVRVMARRWGSYTQDNKISLHPRLIEAPTEAIYYVAIHELCHVNNRKHNEAFYNDMERRISNWREIKERLEIRYG